jgi:formylglycine-generating enzyme required for sulfatase activity
MNTRLINRKWLGSTACLVILAFAFGYRWLAPRVSLNYDLNGSITSVTPKISIPDINSAASSDTALNASDGNNVSRPKLESPPQVVTRNPKLTKEQRKQFNDALSRAELAQQNKQWLHPENDNAIYWYEQALTIDPKNPTTQSKKKETLLLLIEQAHVFIDGANLKEAANIASSLSSFTEIKEELRLLNQRYQNQPQVEALLRQGAQRIAAGNRFEPESESALASYRAALNLDPRSLVAKQGLAEVATAILNRALIAASDNHFNESDQLIQLANTLANNTKAQLDTQSRIAELKRQRAENLFSAIQSALDARQISSAQSFLDSASEIVPNDTRILEYKTRIENATIYNHFNPGDVFADAFVDREGKAPQLVVIPVGEFSMGSSKAERGHRADESPQRNVSMRQAFALAKTETTVAAFRQFITSTSYVTDAEKKSTSTFYDEKNGRIAEGRNINWRHNFMGDPAQDEEPVVHVSAHDAQAYVSWLSERTEKAYRLPSEAEFEYVLRAGSQTRFYWGNGNPKQIVGNLAGDGDRSLSKRTWSRAFPGYRDGYWGPAPVAQFMPNAFGAYDMGGNVSEWVQDCWHDSYLRAPENGAAWVNAGCTKRVVRGGSWGSATEQFRSAYRMNANFDTRSARIGFRVARNLQ